jgi:hypothetical protein
MKSALGVTPMLQKLRFAFELTHADVNAKNNDGWDATFMAIIYKHHEIQNLRFKAEAVSANDAPETKGKDPS